MHFYFIESRLPSAEVISLLSKRKGPALALKPEIACVKEFIIFTHAASYKAFLCGTNRARDFGVEWLARLACTTNLKAARKRCQPNGSVAGIVSEHVISSGLLLRLGRPLAFERPPDFELRRMFSLPDVAYSVEDLLCEKSAVEFMG